MQSSTVPARFPGPSGQSGGNPGGNPSSKAGSKAGSKARAVRPTSGSAPRGGRAATLRLVRPGESGTTTAEYTVVTAAAVAFGALLLKLLTGSWGQKILETAFREVIKMLGF